MKETITVQQRAAGARVLLVDNFSSFTFNLYQYLAGVTGLAPVVLKNNHSEGIVREDFDLVVLSPGPGSPRHARDFGICTAMLAQKRLPVLGVCLGHQGLGVACGADLQLAPEIFHGRSCLISHEGGPLFAGIPDQFTAVRYHSLRLKDPLPGVLECIAKSSDGTIMAIRHKERPQWGVQFHPESAETEHGPRLLANFCAMALGREAAEDGQQFPVPPIRSSSRTARVSPKKTAARWRLVTHVMESGFSAERVYEATYGASLAAFWLDGGATSGYSYMGDDHGNRSYTIRYEQAKHVAHFRGAKNKSMSCESIFPLLQRELDESRVESDESNPFDFIGGFVGYFGYELRGDLGSTVAHHSEFPDALWMWVDRFIAFDHSSGQVTLCALVPVGGPDLEAHAWFEEVSGALASPVTLPPLPEQTGPLKTVARESRSEYEEMIARSQEFIRRGESYELCLTTQLSSENRAEPNALFRVMRRDNPAPYAALLRCGDFSIVSASPERFLKIDRDGYVESKPIKGTAPRSADPEVDLERADALRESVKERAENLMIVDLVRNDLGKNCEVGSVVVKELGVVESFATVHQLVSTVAGQLRPEVAALQCIRDAFPGGSMTGAPKLRSMEILDSIEAAPRGPYAGALGYLGGDGAVDLSIVIRSVIVGKKGVTMGVGGAITALSEPAAEYEEMQLKALGQRIALEAAALED